MTKTAEALGLERSHLYKKLKALGIERPVED
jgi:DNA-binding NtrC family response regulator